MIHVQSYTHSKTAKLIQFTNGLGVGAVFNSQETPLGKDFHVPADTLIKNKVIKSCGFTNQKRGRAYSNYIVLSLASYGTASEASNRRNARMFSLPDVKLNGWAKDLFMYASPVPSGIGRVYGEWE